MSKFTEIKNVLLGALGEITGIINNNGKEERTHHEEVMAKLNAIQEEIAVKKELESASSNAAVGTCEICGKPRQYKNVLDMVNKISSAKANGLPGVMCVSCARKALNKPEEKPVVEEKVIKECAICKAKRAYKNQADFEAKAAKARELGIPEVLCVMHAKSFAEVYKNKPSDSPIDKFKTFLEEDSNFDKLIANGCTDRAIIEIYATQIASRMRQEKGYSVTPEVVDKAIEYYVSLNIKKHESDTTGMTVEQVVNSLLEEISKDEILAMKYKEVSAKFNCSFNGNEWNRDKRRILKTIPDKEQLTMEEQIYTEEEPVTEEQQTVEDKPTVEEEQIVAEEQVEYVVGPKENMITFTNIEEGKGF